ncbi:MAG: prepilin-type N-terminal cleavage/methylation domain-containing protein [Minisyncoccia bacterium]
MSKNLSCSLRTSPKRGFSLVELLVVLSIISIITSIALMGQSTFNRSILLTNTAYSLALSMREMQALGLSSRKYAGVQDAGYGAYFGTPPLTEYTLFADTVDADAAGILVNCKVGQALAVGNPEKKPGDCLYTTGSDALIRNYVFSRGYYINRYCAQSGASTYCSTDASPNNLTGLHIVFVRSTTETAMTIRRNGSWVAASQVQIYLRGGEIPDERAVCLTTVGQISVSLTTCS